MSLITQSFSWATRGFETLQSETLNLRLLLSETELFFAITNDANQLVSTGEMKAAPDLSEAELLESFLIQQKEIKKNFQSVKYISTRGLFSIIPAAVFRAEDESAFFQLLGGDFDEELSAMKIKISFPDAWMMYGVNTKLKAKMDQHFPSAQIMPLGLSCLNLAKAFLGTKQDSIYLHVGKKRIWIVSIKSGNLRICNSYEYRDFNDILYFLQLTTKVSELNDQNPQMGLGGWVENEGPLHKHLKKYFPALTVPETFFRNQFAEGNEKTQASKYAILAF